jgi:hypothetical protein
MICRDENSLDMFADQLHYFRLFHFGDFRRLFVFKIKLKSFIKVFQSLFARFAEAGHVNIKTLGDKMFAFLPDNVIQNDFAHADKQMFSAVIVYHNYDA